MTHPAAAIIGVGRTRLERRSKRSIGALAVEAALDAIADAGLSIEDIDGYVGAPGARDASALHADGVDETSAVFMGDALGLTNAAWLVDVGDMAGGMIVAATHALIARHCRCVLAVRALYNPPDRPYSRSEIRVAAGPEQFTLPYGIGPGGGRFAHWLQRYMHDHGATREDLYEIAKLGRENAQLNPFAIWRGTEPLAKDAYMASRWINEPMCIFDADMPITGAAALVMTTIEGASSWSRPAALVKGYANSANSRSLLSSCGLTPSDIQVAQIYDGYSPMVWLWLERLGFCGEGEAYKFARGAEIRSGGKLPLNTFGGALGEGRLHGMGHLLEGALQAMGRADRRQVKDVRNSLVQIGTPERSWTIVLGTAASD